MIKKNQLKNAVCYAYSKIQGLISLFKCISFLFKYFTYNENRFFDIAFISKKFHITVLNLFTLNTCADETSVEFLIILFRLYKI